jgi:hypothetical protein
MTNLERFTRRFMIAWALDLALQGDDPRQLLGASLEAGSRLQVNELKRLMWK